MENRCLSTVQGLLILKELSMAKNSFGMVSLLTDLALRYSRSLNFHMDETPQQTSVIPWVVSEQRRRVWWLSFNYTRWMSMRPNGTGTGTGIGNPIHADDSNCTQCLPAADEYFQAMDPEKLVPFEQRPIEQQIPFQEILLRIRHIPVRLDGFALLTLITRTYGHIIRFVRAAR